MKSTAANTALLAVVKRIFNHKIYKHALSLYNTEGENAMLEYLQQFITPDIYPWLMSMRDEYIQRRADDRARCFKHLIR